ncbi:MAG: hypothetical protein CO119_11445 [Flavobacteriales bacterium CG_4_9_14_3_um_filter_40_17]|nr:MAG: hypothetical protein CO119_11445 [Flavobacteriales bacterium CG_4_9_14_3_um_filter_40_17]
MKNKLILFIFFFAILTHAQERVASRTYFSDDFYLVLNAFKALDIEKSDSLLKIKSFENEFITDFFCQQLDEFKNGDYEAYKSAKTRFDTRSDTSVGSRFLKEIVLGDLAVNEKISKDSLGFDHYLKAKTIAEAQKNDTLRAEVLKRIMRYLFKSEKNGDLYEQYMKEYKTVVYDDYEKLYAVYYDLGLHMVWKFYDDPNLPSPIGLCEEGIELSKKLGATYMEGRFCQLLGVNYDLFEKDPKKGYANYQKAIDKFETIPYYYAQSSLFGMYSNQGSIFQDTKAYPKAMEYYHKALKIPIRIKNRRDLILLYNYMYLNQKAQKQMDSAVYYLELKNKMQDELDLLNNALAVDEIQTKYETEKKEKENLQLKQNNLILENQKNFNRNMSIFAFIIFIIATANFVLIYKNLKKKQKLIEQEKRIAMQHTEKLLQQQEITAIDAMIRGQEQERKRLANELHDNLGSLLATLKLNFQSFSEKIKHESDDNQNILKHSEELLEQAYQKVRMLSHSKNAGVMANQGLLPALKKFADDVSKSEKLKVAIQEFGLNERLDNSLEILLFRIIQELVANIIKHAEATQADIYLTQYSERINLMVEDNGNGFDTHQIVNKNGMGLVGIEKRVQNLDGNMEIESIKGKGTTVIINIPI